jgi:hypothetical protein
VQPVLAARIPLFPLNPACSSIDFIQDNELSVKIEKKFCEGIETTSECLESIITVPKKTQEALLFYSYKRIQYFSSNITALKNKSSELFYTQLICYSQTLAGFFNSKSFKKLDHGSLFDHYLPALFTDMGLQENPDLIKIWTPYISSMIKNGDFLSRLKSIADIEFRYFILTYFTPENYFEGLEQIEKYKFSVYALENSQEVGRPLSMELKLKIIAYLKGRDLSWDFPKDLVLKFQNDSDFEALFHKIFKLSQLKSRDIYFNYFNESFNDLIASGKTAYPIRCALAQDFQTLIVDKKTDFTNEKNKIIKDLLKNEIPCISQMKKELKSFDSSTTEFVDHRCPQSPACYQHFLSNEWMQSYSTCQKDADCKTLKYDNCERLFFNEALPTNEIQLYSQYCQRKGSPNQALVNTPLKGMVCLDNICQGRKY